MPEVGLERPRVVALVGEGIATGVSQHVWVRFEPKLGVDTCGAIFSRVVPETRWSMVGGRSGRLPPVNGLLTIAV